MPVSDLEIATSLFWLFGYMPSDNDSRELVDRLDLRKVHDAAQLRAVLLGSEPFRRRQALSVRRPGHAALDVDAPRLLFLHIPKCGGTTFHTTLSRHFDPDRICPERFNDLRAFRLGDLARFRLFSGHFDLDSARALFGGATTIVTLLREPRARLVSLYCFLRMHRPEQEPASADMVVLAKSLTIEAFFRHPLIRRHASVRDAMTTVLLDPLTAVRWEALEAQLPENATVLADPAAAGERAFRVLSGLGGFGLLERFADSLSLMSATLGLHLESVPPQQVTEEMARLSHLDGVERPAMTADLSAILDDLTVADRALYASAATLFATRLDALGDAPPDPPLPSDAFGAPLSISLDRFHPLEARRDGVAIVASGTAGALAAGPYMALTHGRYRLSCFFTWIAERDPPPRFTVNVWRQKGQARVAAVEWTGSSPCIVDFRLAFDVSDAEFVVRVDADSGFALLGVELARAAAG